MSEECWEKGEDEVNHSEDRDGHDDDLRDFIIDREKEFAETNEEKKDCGVQHDGYVFDHPAYMEISNAFEKERAHSDTT